MTSIRSSQQLGDAIRTARKQLALTQPHLALAAGVGVRIAIGIVAFDSAATVAARLSIVRGPREQTRMITLDTLSRLAAG